ncbi:hypothetical protein EV361DRAFT_868496 [Lentinula raphanica]|nr:hypothetical protein EV361DRAFT_868496 [Lentinula raphanica]
MSPASRLSLHLGRAVQRTQTNTRYLHIKNINGGLQSIVAPGHVHEGGHLPFSYRRKPAFLGKFAAFCTAGFTIPFAAVFGLVGFSGEPCYGIPPPEFKPSDFQCTFLPNER